MRPRPFAVLARHCLAFVAVFATSVATHQIARAAADPDPGASDPRTITMIIGYTAGGGVDATGRLISQFMTKYLPGNPPVVIKNMPGADGRVALNFFVRQVKPDGLTLTTGSSTQLDPRNYRVSTAQYDPTKFNFVGGVSRGGTFQVISKAGEQRLTDKTAAPVPIGAVDGTRSGEQMSSWGMEFLDWNAKWVVGYRGASETTVALERGEVDIVSTSNSFLIKRLTDTGKYKLLSQSGIVVDGKLRRRTDFADTPVMAELISAKLNDKGARDAFSYWEAICLMDPWVALPPDTPAPVVATYREAFNKMAADPEFIEKGKRISEDIAPMTHADIEALVKTAAERLTPEAETFIRAMQTKQGLRPKE
ncbi:MAG TPA: tripartite tricarboxylate transporter substrate-binding protein [Xanthobacteraceae bacterium]|nr:tripartite tricarboxylate transporter substrate-binding protein [Xanthobacteraceae bacterium]